MGDPSLEPVASTSMAAEHAPEQGAGAAPRAMPQPQPHDPPQASAVAPNPAQPSWLARHSVEISVTVAAVLISSIIGWVWRPATPDQAAPQAVSRPQPAATPAGGASAAASDLANGSAWQAPQAARPGDVAEIDTGKISADILKSVLKNPKWTPVIGPIGQYVGLAMKVEASKLSAKGWVVLSSNAVLAVPHDQDFTQPVEDEIMASLREQVPAMLAKAPTTQAGSTGTASTQEPASSVMAPAPTPVPAPVQPSGGAFQP